MADEIKSMQTLVDRAEKHWGWIVAAFSVFCFTSGIAVAHYVEVKPLESRIAVLDSQLKAASAASKDAGKAVTTPVEAVDPIVLKDVSVQTGKSVTTPDGICNIEVYAAFSTTGQAMMQVTLGDDKPEMLSPAVDRRVRLSHGHDIYTIDVHGVRDQTVDFSVIKTTQLP